MDMAVKPRLGIGRRIGPDVARVAVRQIKGKEVCFLLDAADYNKHFTKIGLCMTGRMAQRHEHLLAGPLPVSNVILDDGVAAIKTALVPQPLENTLCSVALLARAAPVFSKPLVHLAGERIQLRAPDRRCSPISRRLRMGQHLRNTVPADPKIPGNLASAQSILEMSVTHLQIQIHGVYPQALPKSERAKVDDFYAARDTTTVPLPWPSIAPPFTSMKGEFEQRLKSVIDEVQSSATPIILFIDEAHTLIGAGGQAGTGDAANLLKPALARGTLRTIAATTWSEYRQHIEKDPALTRRFQPINVDEPDIERCCYMLRGILAPMEAHHNVRISDEAIVSAVTLSSRYIPARQLPDKAVSLLDTACARVAVSQSSVPARIMDTKDRIAALDTEIAAKVAERDLGETNEERLVEAEAEKAQLIEDLAGAETMYAREKEIVDQVLALRKSVAVAEGRDVDDVADARPEEEDAASDATAEAGSGSIDPAAARGEMHARMADLESGNPDDRMVYAHVDAQAVASVISDWTGIPAGRMVQDELQAVLNLADHLQERVIGQDHGLRAIAKRIETNRAGLSNPNKPIGVFMLCGPSGVGKTETALALAEELYGGEQNVITINMSEFQEAHTVSLLKGAPPGYVGYGEGGRLTEAVRRKPYSVVLLDEVEKAHSDIHELFFQVFDKGVMEDGNGRLIDFKNTLILLTSNVGTDVIMDMADQGNVTPDLDELEAALKPYQLDVFPPALLGRIVTIPYFPLGREVLAGIARLKLGAVEKRLKDAHGAVLEYGDDVLDHIVEQCRDPDSGGRMIDNIITNSILPDLSRQVLGRMVSGEAISKVSVKVADGQFEYEFR